jgi:hypothetical protein
MQFSHTSAIAAPVSLAKNVGSGPISLSQAARITRLFLKVRVDEARSPSIAFYTDELSFTGGIFT